MFSSATASAARSGASRSRRRRAFRSAAVGLAAAVVAPVAASLAIAPAAQAADPLVTCDASAVRASQRRWFFGSNAGIDFGTSGNTATAVAITGSSTEGSTVVTDRDGDLLFWSNGLEVRDANHDLMPNGAGLNGNSSATQTVAAFPSLTQAGVYFVVSTSWASETLHGSLFYSVVDMSLNSGLGDVTATKNVLLGAADSASESLTAVPNASGTGFWVITYDAGDPTIHAYEFDGDGPVTGTAVSSTLSSANGSRYGTLNFSGDLTQLVQMSGGAGTGEIRLLDFDAATGAITEEATWTVPVGGGTGSDGYSADFSPSGDYVYATKIFGGAQLYRYQVAGATDGAAVKATEEHLGAIGNGGQVRRGPDGRMYVANRGVAALSVVNAPDDATDPQFVPNGFPLVAGTSSQWGLPQTVTGCSLPALEVSSTTDVSEAEVGDTVTVTFTVTNNGDIAVDDLGVTSPQLGNVVCEPTTAGPGESVTCTGSYVVQEADLATGEVTFTGTASGVPDGATDPVSSDPSSSTVDVVDNTDPVVTVDGPTDGGTYKVGDDVPADFGCQDVDLVDCSAVDGDGNPINAGDPIDTTTPGTYTITVTGTDGAGNTTTRTVTYTVVPACEDGLALLNEPGLDVDRTYVLLSGGVHKGTEDTTRALVDPLTVPLLGLNATDLVHQVNCQIVEPVEDLVDAITVPLIQNLGLQGALRGLFG